MLPTTKEELNARVQDHGAEMFTLMLTNATEWRVFTTLRAVCGPCGWTDIRAETIATLTGLNIETARKALKRLTEDGLIISRKVKGQPPEYYTSPEMRLNFIKARNGNPLEMQPPKQVRSRIDFHSQKRNPKEVRKRKRRLN